MNSYCIDKHVYRTERFIFPRLSIKTKLKDSPLSLLSMIPVKQFLVAQENKNKQTNKSLSVNFSIVAESETVTELFSYLITQCTGREIYLSQQLSLFRLLMTNKIGMKRLLTKREIETMKRMNAKTVARSLNEWMNISLGLQYHGIHER